jgi:hypothetical protein
VSPTFKVGAVLHWKDFTFSDESKKNKYLIVLGAKTNHDFLLVLATSQPHHRSFNHGCHAQEGYYHIPGTGKDFFPKDTWVVLSEPRIASAGEILKESLVKNIETVANLRDDIARAMINCLKKCKDVSELHLSLI